MKRRTFLKTTSAGLFAGMLMPQKISALPVPLSRNIGLQLYSLRNEIKEDLEGSLKKIADIGYYNLEAAGYSNGKFYGLEPATFKDLVQNFGMKVISSHLTFEGDEVQTVLKAHKEAGIKYLVWPGLDKKQWNSPEKYKELAEKFNTAGEFCKENDLQFGFHNHDFEFYPLEGEIPYDILLEYTNPDLVFMQIDLYWITYAGHDPLKYFEKYPGRFKLWHVKDMKAGDEKEMTEVGSGIIDYKTIFENSARAGMKEFFVEQDVIKTNAFDSIKTSFDYLDNILS
ncbi:MAG: sugar phosphate isomerase/epimerase [Bacteroidota bacterium]